MADSAGGLGRYLAESGLRIDVIPSKGRCLVANRDFKTGEVILEQYPFSSVLDTDSKDQRCDGCFTYSTNLKRCSACKSVRYCSTGCQRKEWKVHHSECEMVLRLSKEKRSLLSPSLQLMVRLLIKRSLQSDGVIPQTSVDNYELVEALPTHFSETDEERLVLYAQMSNLVKFIMGPFEINLKEITELFCRFSCNGHTICDEEFRPLGTGLYPVISIINHSCAPNSVLLFDGKRAVVRALQGICEGSEVTVGYVELAGSTASRQKALKEQYFFDCDCQRCRKRGIAEGMVDDAVAEGYRCSDGECEGAVEQQKDWRLICSSCGSIQNRDELMVKAADVKRLLEEARSAQSSNNEPQAKSLYEQAEALQTKVWHKHSVTLLRTRDILLKICMSLQDWQSARKYCQLTLPAYERSYSSHSPLLGLQYYTHGKLEWFLGNTVKAAKSLTLAMKILSITHGSSTRLVQGLSSLLQEASAEIANQLATQC